MNLVDVDLFFLCSSLFLSLDLNLHLEGQKSGLLDILILFEGFEVVKLLKHLQLVVFGCAAA